MFGQGEGMDCFPVALMNACTWEGLEPPSRKQLIKAAKCEYGATISYTGAAALCPLDFEETSNKKVLEAGKGILTIMHPRYNLHACFCVVKDEEIWLANSLLTDKLWDSFKVAGVPFPRFESHNRGWVYVEGGK